MTAICTEERHTSQGVAHCHQPRSHHGADHLAVLEDTDGQLWIVAWHGDYVQAWTVPELERPAA